VQRPRSIRSNRFAVIRDAEWVAVLGTRACCRAQWSRRRRIGLAGLRCEAPAAQSRAQTGSRCLVELGWCRLAFRFPTHRTGARASATCRCPSESLDDLRARAAGPRRATTRRPQLAPRTRRLGPRLTPKRTLLSFFSHPWLRRCHPSQECCLSYPRVELVVAFLGLPSPSPPSTRGPDHSAGRGIVCRIVCPAHRYPGLRDDDHGANSLPRVPSARRGRCERCAMGCCLAARRGPGVDEIQSRWPV